MRKLVAWALLGLGAVAIVAATQWTMREPVPSGPIPAWLPAAIGVGGLAVGWGVTLLLSGTARRVMTWIMSFGTAWTLVVGGLLTIALLRVSP